MAEEKIINTEEILSEEDLDDVAGGSDSELMYDANRLRAMGLLPTNRSVSEREINDAFYELGQRMGIKLGSDLHEGNTPNRHYINHDKKTHREIWEYIDSHYHRGY